MADRRLEIVLTARDITGKAMAGVQGRITRMAKSVATLQGAFAALGGAAGLGLVARNAINTAASFEQLEIKLDALTRGRGTETLNELNAWALEMPVNTQKAVDAFTMMTAMGLEPTIEKMETLVDVASIFGQETMPRVARALGQMQTLGRLSAEELNQLSEAGINARRYLTEAFGKSVEEIQKSQISIEEIINAIWRGLDADFNGAARQAQNSWAGLTATFESYITELERIVLGAGVFDALKDSLRTINTELKGWIDNNQALINNDLPALIELGTEITTVWGKAIATMAQWPKYALAPSQWIREQLAGGLEAARNVAGTRPPSPSAAGFGGAVPVGQRGGPPPFVPYAPTFGGSSVPASGTTSDSYLSADYMASINYLRRGPMFDLEAMRSQVEQGREIQMEMIDSMLEGYSDVERQSKHSFRVMSRSAATAAYGMENSLVNFFDASSEGFLSLENLALSVAQTLQRAFAQFAVSQLIGGIGGGFGGGGGIPFLSQSSSPFFDFHQGGHLGEDVYGMGARSGASYQFHAGENVTPGGAGGGNTYYVINAVDVQSFEDRYRGSITKVTAEELNDNNGALWGALARR